MNTPSTEAREKLMAALQTYALTVHTEQENEAVVQLEKGYTVEIEANGIYKLISDGKVIAPFADLEELCHFIKHYG